MEDTHAFARAFIALAEQRLGTRPRRLSHSEFARRAFGGITDPVRKWRNIRNRSQSLPLHEAVAMAKVLDLDFTYMCHLAAQAAQGAAPDGQEQPQRPSP